MPRNVLVVHHSISGGTRALVTAFVAGAASTDQCIVATRSAPVASVADVLEMAGRLLNRDGCLNQFAGPRDTSFTVPVNFYDVHYNLTRITGNSGGTADSAAVAAKLVAQGRLDVAKVVTHVLGLNAVAETTLNQPEIGGGKKLVYTHKDFDRIELEKVDPETPLGRILAAHDGLWSPEAEAWILANMPDITVPD